MEVAATILLPDDTVCAECQAIVIKPTGEIAESWENEKKYWFVEGSSDSVPG